MENQESAKQKRDLLLSMRIGKDEMNLIEMPFTLLSTRNTTNQTVMERYWEGKGGDGRIRKFYKKITGHPKLGLPTFQAEEVYIALMELSNRQGFEDVNVCTSRYELLKLMDWPTTGHYYQKLIDALDQLLAVTITTNAFWDNTKRTYVTMGFGIIGGYQFFEDEYRGKRTDFDQAPLPPGYITWNKFLFDSFKRGYIKTLNTETYFGMTSRTAKRLYRYVDKHLYRGDSFEIDLFKLAFEKLEMTSSYHYPSEIIRKLEPAIKEHIEKKIAKIKIIKSRITPSSYKVVFSPMTKAQEVMPQLEFELDLSFKSEAIKENTAEPFSNEPDIDEQLIQRGITMATARKLISNYPSDLIQKQIEVLDWLIENKSPLAQKNPAGFLRKSIEENYMPPKEYLDQHEKRDREKEKNNRKERWLKHKEELVKSDITNWNKTCPENRVSGRLDFWIAGEKLNSRWPTEEQIEAMRQELINNLPKTDEEKWDHISRNYPDNPPDEFE